MGIFNFIKKHYTLNDSLSPSTELILQKIQFDWDNRYTAEELNKFYVFNDNIVPQEDTENGHVIMLWWLSKYDPTVKEVPSYFFFQYGLKFSDEIRVLNNQGLLENFKLTDKGTKLLNKSAEIIQKHRFPNGETKLTLFDKLKFKNSHIDLSKIKPVLQDVLSNEAFNEGLELLNKAKVLSKEKLYKESNEAIFKAWKLGYQVPATFNRAAINCRQLKEYNLEVKIIELGIAINNFNDYSNLEYMNNKLQERLEKVKKLQRKNIK